MKKVELEIKVKVVVYVSEGMEISDVVFNRYLIHDFHSEDPSFYVFGTEIKDFKIRDIKNE
ncbi:MAG: hypothetical protein M0P71_00855 [Melioribacteraceae bacterium]|nr:hypothetical protein [Melioribacteraceae bacterium]